MNNNCIAHHGIKGMRWGVRRTKEQLGRASGKSKNQNDDEKKASSSKGGFFIRRKTASEAKNGEKEKKKTSSDSPSEASRTLSTKPESKRYTSIKEVPDAELRAAVARLQLEKQYRDLIKDLTPKQKKTAMDITKSILAESGRKVAGEATTYLMRQAVNSALKSSFGGDKKKK